MHVPTWCGQAEASSSQDGHRSSATVRARSYAAPAHLDRARRVYARHAAGLRKGSPLPHRQHVLPCKKRRPLRDGALKRCVYQPSVTAGVTEVMWGLTPSYQ